MRLCRLRVQDYRSFLDINVDFPNKPVLPGRQSSIHFVVGLNGTGKSNLLRVLAHIFIGLEMRDAPQFPFELEYELLDHRIAIVGDGQGTRSGVTFTLTHRQTGSQQIYEGGEWPSESIILPEYLVAYSSGVLSEWLDIFRQRVADEEEVEAAADEALIALLESGGPLEEVSVPEESPEASGAEREVMSETAARIPLRSLFVHPDTIKLALLATLALPEAEDADLRQAIFERVGLQRLTHFSLRLATGPAPLIPHQEERLKALCASARIYGQADGYLAVFKMNRDTIASLSDQIGNPLQLYRFLLELHQQGVLRDAHLVIKKKDVEDLLLDVWLSDGENMFLGRMALFLMLRHAECLFLLDEPESHFNDRWKRELIDIADTILQDVPSDVLIATHSSLTLTDVFANEIVLLRNDERGYAHAVEVTIPTFGADPTEIMVGVFGAEDSIGKRATEFLDRVLETADPAEMRRYLNMIGAGYYQFELRRRLRSLEGRRATPSQAG